MPYNAPIPTEYQPAKGKTKYGNNDLTPEHKLKLTVEKSPSLLALENAYANEPSTESLVHGAQDTLERTRPTANRLYAAGLSKNNPADDAAAGEESRTRNAEYRDIADAVLGGAAMVPGPVGVAGRLGSSALGAYDMTQEGPNLGNVLQTSMSAYDLVPALRALKGEHPMSGVSPRVTGQGSEIPYRLPSDHLPPPEGAPYRIGGPNQKFLPPLNVQEGEIIPHDAPRQLTAGARPMPQSSLPDSSYVRGEPGQYARSTQRLSPEQSNGDLLEHVSQGATPDSMRALQDDQFGTDLTDEMNAIANDKNVYDDAGRMVAPPQPEVDPSYVAHVQSSRNKYSDPKMDRLLKSMFGDNVPPGVSRMTAEQALMDDSSIGNTVGGKKTPIAHSSDAQKTPLFGGATSQQEGTFGEYVRPKHRYPIGSNSPRVTPRDQNVTWNK